jgi:hypothetical protein
MFYFINRNTMPLHLSSFFNAIQTRLFPVLEETIGVLSDREQRFVRICELVNIEKYLPYSGSLTGRPPARRTSIARAFIAKSLYNFATTSILHEHLLRDATLRHLCGWNSKRDVPSESTFSRAFAEFALTKLPCSVHESMIKTHCGPKLAGHISRDATAIEAREKPIKKESFPKSAPRKKKGRPCKGEKPHPKNPTKLEIQLTRGLNENLADIPTVCDWGTKRDSKGNSYSWVGYKLHIDTIDGDIPASAILSSASMHDSQAAIPLAQTSALRVTNLYDLMDAAYDCGCIREMSTRLNHVAIIDSNKRKGDKIELEPAEKIRYNQRSSAERVNSNLKDNYGGSTVRVKGAQKVMTHLMFGVIALTAEALFRLIS